MGGRQAVEHLLASGSRGPVHVVGEDPSPEATAGRDRMAGITAALAEAGMSLAGVVPCPWGVRPAYDAVDAWLRTGARPGALICLNDRIAMGVYQALAEHGLAVPGDVAVDLLRRLGDGELAAPARDFAGPAVQGHGSARCARP